uniref:Uncharacterized protein n=1 Tax=Meloidogyne enterolobii TaxID=390850 RepID=A0A6V7UAK9_MELEN|nr:unnamed protein product [Meloidogyne enterolobii]
MPTFAPPESYYPVRPPNIVKNFPIFKNFKKIKATGPDQFSSLSSRREIPPVQTFTFGGSDSSHLPPPPPPPPSTNFERPMPQQIVNNLPQPSQQNFNQQNLHQSNIQSQGLPQTTNIRNNMPQHPMPPAYNPAFKVNQAESEEENQQQPAEPRNPNSAREQPPFETSNGFNDQNRQNEKQQKEKMKQERGRNVNNNVASSSGYSDDNLINTAVDNRQQQAEKPKVFGLSQQEVPHLEMEGGSDMSPIEMRNHLRSQLKSRKGRNDDTK